MPDDLLLLFAGGAAAGQAGFRVARLLLQLLPRGGMGGDFGLLRGDGLMGRRDGVRQFAMSDPMPIDLPPMGVQGFGVLLQFEPLRIESPLQFGRFRFQTGKFFGLLLDFGSNGGGTEMQRGLLLLQAGDVAFQFLHASRLMRQRRRMAGDDLAAGGAIAFGFPEFLIEAADLAVERRGILLESALFLVDLGKSPLQLRLPLFEPRLFVRQAAVIVGGESVPPGLQFLADLAEFRRLGGLVPRRRQPGFDFVDDVRQPQQILAHALQLALRVHLPRLISTDARGFFEDGPSIGRVGLQDLIDAALLDDAVGRRSGAEKQILHVFEPGRRAIDEILAVAVAPDAATDLHFRHVERQQARSVVEGERRFGEAARFAAGRAIEDDVGHLLAAETLRGLIAQQPFEGVDDVAFAGAVRTDDARHARSEIEPDAIGEALETMQFQRLQHRSTLTGRKVGAVGSATQRFSSPTCGSVCSPVLSGADRFAFGVSLAAGSGSSSDSSASFSK